MSIPFIPSNQEVILKGQKPHEEELISVLTDLILAVNKLEQQLEFITNEKIED